MTKPTAINKQAANESFPPPCPAADAWLRRGLGHPGGKLPLFDEEGQRIPAEIIKTCLEQGWAEPWFSNPLKPEWLICKLTPEGRAMLGALPPPT